MGAAGAKAGEALGSASGAECQYRLRFWRENFDADSGATGRTIGIDGEPHTIVGVLTSDSRVHLDADVLVSFGWLVRQPRKTHGEKGSAKTTDDTR